MGYFTLKIAQPFRAGCGFGEKGESREGRQKGSFVPDGTFGTRRAKPSPEGLGYFRGAAAPSCVVNLA